MSEHWKLDSGRGSGLPREDARYANFFQVGYNPFEFLLEFGQGAGRVHTSMYMSPQHAMMLYELLQEILEKYQAAYGFMGKPAKLG
jgi:hypothetical protein